MKKYRSEQQQISYLNQSLKHVSDIMAMLNNSDDVAIFLGPTKSGKSTLINYLLGVELKAEFNERLFTTSIKRVSELDIGPSIGVGIESETNMPSKWENAPHLPNLVLYDAPSFGDNRGVVQAVTNACFIYQIFQIAKTLKIVLVFDFAELFTNRMNCFLSLLRNLETLLLSAMPKCYASIVMAINKVPLTFYDKPVNVPLICNLLKTRILRNQSISMSQACQDFVKHLIKNQHQIGLFKEAKIGPFPEDIDQGVAQSILSINSVSSNDVKDVVRPKLDDESRVFLLNAQENIILIKTFIDICEFVKQICEEKLESCMTLMDDVQVESSKSKLTEVAEKLTILSNDICRISMNDQSLDLMIISLMNIDVRIGDMFDQNDLLKKTKLIMLCDQLLDKDVYKHSNIYKLMIQIVKNQVFWKVEEAKIRVDKKLDKITEAEFNTKMENVIAEKEEEIKRLEKELDESVKEKQNLRCDIEKYRQKVCYIL